MRSNDEIDDNSGNISLITYYIVCSVRRSINILLRSGYDEEDWCTGISSINDKF